MTIYVQEYTIRLLTARQRQVNILLTFCCGGGQTAEVRCQMSHVMPAPHSTIFVLTVAY